MGVFYPIVLFESPVTSYLRQASFDKLRTNGVVPILCSGMGCGTRRRSS